MSREVGKLRPAAKKQTRPPRKGERSLEQQALTLETKADQIVADSAHHSKLLTKQNTSDIQASVEQLQLEAERLKIINSNPYKTRSRQIDTVEEVNSKQTSSEGEKDEAHSRLGSMDTQPYTGILSSPFTNSMSGKSPLQVEQPLAIQFNNTPPFGNPQFNMNPPPALPNVSTAPMDPMIMMQAMFAQQAQANRQQQEAMLAQQAQISKHQAEANQQLQLLLAKSLDRQLDQQDKQLQYQTNIVERQAIADARIAVKPMKEGTNIVQYFEHFEAELEDAQIPLAKWKAILVGKLSTKAEKVCAHLVNDQAAIYDDMKRHLLVNIGPSTDELCNIFHGAFYTEFQDKKEAQKLQHSKYIAERYFLGAKNNIEHMAVRLYKFYCHKRFSHAIKLSKSQSFAELLEMATSFDGQLDYEKTSKLHNNNNHHNHYNKPFQKKPFCEFCRRPGHSETDCFKKQGANKSQPSTQNKTTYRPNSQDNQASNNTKHNKFTHKDTGVKSRSAVVNWS